MFFSTDNALRRRAAVLPLVLSLLFALCQSAAAFDLRSLIPGSARARQGVSWNPHPDADPARDVILPMPGQQGMVFRVVAVPARGLLWSLETVMGMSDEKETDRMLQDGSWRSRLSAPFTANDVPQSWKASLPGDGSGNYYYYLIAKYEVTRGQYRAVMEESFTPGADDNLPVTNVSWYDATLFTERYTDWLLQNHPGALPAFKGDTRNTGYVRLPTEAEWEYAARGGQHESTNYQQQPFFTMAEGTSIRDYAVMGSALAPAGSLRPNPLGLYDTAGNAAEMTLDCYRLSLAGTLQGAAGGFVSKGGSYLSDADMVLPGRREELPLFTAAGVTRAPWLGFRPVVSGINTPGGERLSALLSEYEAMSGQQPSGDDAAATPMEELNRLLSRTTDLVMRSHLLSLRARLSESNILQARDRAARAENQLQKCVMTLESARNIEHKSYILRDLELAAINDALRAAANTAQKQEWQKRKRAREKELAANDRLLEQALSDYIRDMGSIRDMAADDVLGGFQDLSALYRGEGRFNYRMSRTLGIVRNHYEILTHGSQLDMKRILNDLVNGG